MPWNEVTVVTLRAEFVRLALNEDANISQLCERFQISRKTATSGWRAFAPTAIRALATRAADRLSRPVVRQATRRPRCSDCETSTPHGEVENSVPG